MVNTTFQPQQIEVTVGTTVIWTNQDADTHTVTAGPRENPTGLFSSGDIAAGGTFSFTFTEPGTYVYHCAPHSGMDGTVIVTAGTG
ncbi:MAG: cupredoxin domain-containing protein [Chloroflexi bacterium]|nr:cupredoxin domain-containing protein [Chloroflexota bacterium]